MEYWCSHDLLSVFLLVPPMYFMSSFVVLADQSGILFDGLSRSEYFQQLPAMMHFFVLRPKNISHDGRFQRDAQAHFISVVLHLALPYAVFHVGISRGYI